MASYQHVTPDDLVTVAQYIGELECIQLASALGFDLPYCKQLTSTVYNKRQPYDILFDWQAAKGCNATKEALCMALNKIGRQELAEKIGKCQREGEAHESSLKCITIERESRYRQE